MRFTDLFIRRPVLSIVISLLILVLGARAIGMLSVQQYPTIESAVITINTSYMGASPSTIATFITSPLEQAIAQANGIDYMTSNSTQNTSMIQANLLLNYDPDKALTEINTQVNSVLNQLPADAQLPVLTVTVGETIDSMYLGFNSDQIPANKITDYLLRSVQPKLQAVKGVQTAQVLGQSQIALRVWLDPNKLAGYGLTTSDVAKVLSDNNFISAAGRTDGDTFILNLNTNTALTTVNEFKQMVIKSENGAIIRLGDIAKVSLGQENYNTDVMNNRKPAVFIGIVVAPTANLLTVLDNVKKVFAQAQKEMPSGINSKIIYDASLFVTESISQVNDALIEAFLIVTAVVFLFLGSLRALFIPVIAIPLSIIGTFFLMLLLGYTINILTLLAMVLAIGLVVDDAIIVVENVARHMEEGGKTAFQAAILSARELAKPIIAISIVLIAVYLPIGFMGGLTGALFTEFAFTLAGAVGISAIVALTLSPMLCSRMLKNTKKPKFIEYFDDKFENFRFKYQDSLVTSLKYLSVVMVFAIIILSSNFLLFATSQSELAPQEDQGIILTQLTENTNASLSATSTYSQLVSKIFSSHPETETTFQVDGFNGANNAPNLNLNMGGMVLKNWDQRKLTSNQLQPIVQKETASIAGGQVAVFQPPSLPGGGSGLPLQFVIESASPLDQMDKVSGDILDKARKSGKFQMLTSDLFYNMQEGQIQLNKDKIAEFGLTLKDVGNAISSALSENYINYFDYMGRSYQVIPQTIRDTRLNTNQLLNYYINTAMGKPISLATVASIKTTIGPQSENHFQQLNSVTLSGIPAPGVSMGDALKTLNEIAKPLLPQGYTINYASQSRQYMSQSNAMVMTFLMALIIIFLSLAVLFNSFRDPLIVLISVPMSICGAMIFISLGIGDATLNIYTEVGLVTLIGLISKHGILIVEFANELQEAGKSKWEAITSAASIRFRPILMTTAAMVLGVIPLIRATGAGAESRFDIGLVIATGISIGTCFTLFVVPAMYMLIAEDYATKKQEEELPE
ncbi:MAG: multidrug efflux protein [Legionellales bacterium]|nr:multidrug efflux protein [Legionellales bacterium]